MWQSALTRQLHDPELACQIRDILATTRLAADNLVLDITETSLVDHLDFAIEDMRRLKKLGVRLAIDDFGAGYSSLSCLKRLPVDIVKIDRALIGGAAPIGHYPKPPLARCTRLRRDRMCDQGDQPTATVNLSGDPAKFRFVLDGGFVFRPGPGRFDPRGGTRAYTLMGVQEAATFEGSDGHGITLQWRSPSGQRVALNRGVMNIVFQKGSCPSG